LIWLAEQLQRAPESQKGLNLSAASSAHYLIDIYDGCLGDKLRIVLKICHIEPLISYGSNLMSWSYICKQRTFYI
jgi:hypothetical protein